MYINPWTPVRKVFVQVPARDANVMRKLVVALSAVLLVASGSHARGGRRETRESSSSSSTDQYAEFVQKLQEAFNLSGDKIPESFKEMQKFLEGLSHPPDFGGEGASLRQLDSSAFAELANKFKETFKPGGGSGGGDGGGSPFDLNSLQSSFSNHFGGGSGSGKREMDASQLSQLANKFQEAFKPGSFKPPSFEFGNVVANNHGEEHSRY